MRRRTVGGLEPGAASSQRTVPVTLTSAYSPGSSILGRTPARAARWTIGSGRDRFDQVRDPSHVADIQLDQPVPGFPQCIGQVRLLGQPGVERVEVVDDDDLRPIAQQSVDQVRPDEARPAGHDLS